MNRITHLTAIGLLSLVVAASTLAGTVQNTHIRNAGNQIGRTASNESASRFKRLSLQVGAAWPKFRSDFANTAQSPFGGCNGILRWSFTTVNSIASSPAIGADGTIYVGSNDTNLYAINSDGTKKWSFPTGGAVVSAPAVGLDGTIYVGSYDYHVYAINPNGTLKWTFLTGGYVQSSPTVGTDGTIYVGSTDNQLYAIKPDGTQKWAFPTNNPVQSSPAIGADGTIYVGSVDDNLYAVNPNGSLKWSFPTNSGIVSSPAIGKDGTIYIGSEDGNIYAVSPTGNLEWSFYTYSPIYSSPAIASDGTVYVGSGNTLNAFTATGYLKWWDVTNGQTVSSPAIGADGIIYVGDNTGHLSATGPDGLGLWYILADGPITSSPAIGADGTVYFGCGDGNLHAIGTQVNTVPVGAMSVDPTTLVGGARSTGYVTLQSPAPAGGDVISLISNDPSVTVPGFVYVQPGMSAASFAVNTYSVSQNTTATITASSGGVNTTATLTVQVAGLNSLFISPYTVVGGVSSIGTVVLSSPAGPSGVTLMLGSSNTSAATVPASVTVPAGKTSVSFPIATISGSQVQTSTISATVNGNTASGQITVNPANLVSIAVTPSSVVGGVSSVVGTVTLATPAPTGGALINMASASLSAHIPTTLTVPAGATSTNFSITTTGVSATTLVTLTATYGSTVKTCVLALQPAAISSVSLSPNSVVGGSANTVSGTVTINGQAGPAGAVVTVTSSNASAATVPAKVTIAAGANSATFTVNTLGVTTKKSVTITASYGGKSASAMLSVNPASLSSVSVNPASLVGGNGSSGGTVTLDGAAPTGGITVSLRSSNPALTVPNTVNVPAGAITANFKVATAGVSVTSVVTITATSGETTKTCTVTLNPAQLVTLSVSPGTVAGGITPYPSGTVTLNGKAGNSPVSVTLTSSNPAVVSVPVVVTIAAQKAIGTFSIKTTNVLTAQTVTITAASNGVTLTTMLTVTPPGLASVKVLPSSIVGGNSSSGGMVTLDAAAPEGGAYVFLSSANSVLHVPASVQVPAGSKTAKFAITTSGVDSNTDVVIFGSLGESVKTCTVTVLPAGLAGLSVTPNIVSASSSTQVTGTVTLNGQAGPSGIKIALSSSDSLIAKVPATVTVAAGAKSGTFAITKGTKTKAATISASLGGVGATAQFTLTP